MMKIHPITAILLIWLIVVVVLSYYKRGGV